MQLAYDSLTGTVRRFTLSLQAETGLDAFDVRTAAPDGPFLLLTYTFGTGQVPETTARFLEAHAAGLRGVVVSGSFHWGRNFGRAGDLIAGRYGVPLVARLNKAGSQADRDAVLAWLRPEHTTATPTP